MLLKSVVPIFQVVWEAAMLAAPREGTSGSVKLIGQSALIQSRERYPLELLGTKSDTKAGQGGQRRRHVIAHVIQRPTIQHRFDPVERRHGVRRHGRDTLDDVR